MQSNDFVQSLMYNRGVACFSCHDAHGTENAAQLREPPGEMCFACHGPRMGRIPPPSRKASRGAPAETAAYEIPNACIACHSDKSTEVPAGSLALAWMRCVHFTQKPAGQAISRENVSKGAVLAYGEPVELAPKLAVDVIFAIDSDLLSSARGHLRFARDFASRRNPTRTRKMSRIYAAEPTPGHMSFTRSSWRRPGP